MNYPSQVLELVVNEFAKLPGIGKKTALRLALHLIKRKKNDLVFFSESLLKLANDLRYCTLCHNVSDSNLCEICSSFSRKKEQLCVVEDLRDVMAIENTQQYFWVYHVLGGVIAPMEGIGPDTLNVNSLLKRVETGEIKEIILALNATMEGDTTAFYISKKLQPYDVKISTISRGISVGGELEYADEITLGRAITSRVNYGG
ncbi:MAG: recombination mediator RecR [Bacteroidetes bacterium]|nr:recombination mediator RecR [Bacteroidota bacterium]